MAAYNGTKGIITFGAQVAPDNQLLLCDQWSCTITRETNDVSTFEATQNSMDFLGGLYSGSGTCEGFVQNVAADKFTMTALNDSDYVPTANSFVLTAMTGRTITFAGIVTSFEPMTEHGKPNRFRCAFDIDGVVTFA
jgi:hypothetical protein